MSNGEHSEKGDWIEGFEDVNRSTAFNLTLEEYLLVVRGPKHLPFDLVLTITVIYALIFVAGIVGNVCVCAVIARNQSMHTATNYYLFSLAVSDITILLFGLPNDLNVYWQQYPWSMGETFCKMRALISEMTSYTSVLTIVAFSMERYLAICHPLHSYAMSGLRRALRIIGALWFASLMAALPFAFFTKINYVDYPPDSGHKALESAFCAMLDENIPSNWPVYELSSFIFFFLPMVAIGVLYGRMGAKIRRTNCILVGNRPDGTLGSSPGSRSSAMHGESRQTQSRKTVVRMLAAVVIAFFVCWAPFHAQRLLYVYAKNSPNYVKINEWMYYITGCFYYFSSTVNPILYNVMSAKYRMAFQETLCCIFPRQRQHHHRHRHAQSRRGVVASYREPSSSSLLWMRTRSTIERKFDDEDSGRRMVVNGRGEGVIYDNTAPNVSFASAALFQKTNLPWPSDLSGLSICNVSDSDPIDSDDSRIDNTQECESVECVKEKIACNSNCMSDRNIKQGETRTDLNVRPKHAVDVLFPKEENASVAVYAKSGRKSCFGEDDATAFTEPIPLLRVETCV